MLNYNFIMPTSGSITFDGTILIAIATIFVVAYLYKNRNNLKSSEINLETNKESNIKTYKEVKPSTKEDLTENIQESNRNTNLNENSEELINEQEKIKLYS